MKSNCYDNLGELSAETLVCRQKQCLSLQNSARQGYWKNGEHKNAELVINSEIKIPATESPNNQPCKMKTIICRHPPLPYTPFQ